MIVNLLFPRRCPVCGDVVKPEDGNACKECMCILKQIREPKCYRCGKPIGKEEQEYCMDCGKSTFHFERNHALWIYDGVMRRSISEYKYKRRREYTDYYVEEACKHLGGYINKHKPDALVPIPLHPSKLRTRGFNQAEWMAKGIGEKMGIPVLADVLIRTKKTTPQKELNDKERKKNLEDAFTIKKEKISDLINIKIVLLIDDIYTTGSTLDVCAKVIKEAGVRKVYAMTLCIGRGF